MVTAHLPFEPRVILKIEPTRFAPPPLVTPYRLPCLSNVNPLHRPPGIFASTLNFGLAQAKDSRHELTPTMIKRVRPEENDRFNTASHHLLQGRSHRKCEAGVRLGW